MDIQSRNSQLQENAFEELTVCSETSLDDIKCNIASHSLFSHLGFDIKMVASVWNVQNVFSGFYTKGRPLVKSNLICPSDKLSCQPGCPVLNTNIQGNFCISQGYGSSDNLPENLV